MDKKLRDGIEREANLFAMELLMPEHLLRADIAKMGGVDISNDVDGINKLARRYGVTDQVMAVRIGYLLHGEGSA